MAIAVVALTACAGIDPTVDASKDRATTPEQSHEDVLDILDAIESVVGTDGWDDSDSSWGTCPSHGGDGAQFSLYAARRLRLPGTPDAVTNEVAKALESAGYKDVRIQHDPSLKPARTVIGYPNGYNNGTAEDGFGIQFQAGTDYAAAIISGHCVPGKAPKLGDPLNPRPTDLP
ncbi:hypothetical protein ACTJKO_10125 [Curtobacterium sp. 22159]|uniref:hypothetical protein n=1 Tax=Curtobacterium sp. 22159 TaxID=3453882 RepID=UPI003F85441F